MQYKLGKAPARPGAVKLQFASYGSVHKLPEPPAEFGHEALLGTDCGMLANDQFGDCVWAGAAHETMLWTREGSRGPASFTEANVLADYAAVTGFKPHDPKTDQGTDMSKAAEYRRKTGVIDAHGHRHKIASYLALRDGDLHQHLTAAYIFGAVGIGVMIGSRQGDQFDQHKPWDGDLGSDAGGHYVPLIGFRNGNLLIVTWGRVQEMTPAFFRKWNDESICYLTFENFAKGKNIEGFNTEALHEDMKHI